MGIDGFHQATKAELNAKHLSAYANQRIGIDASGWLHRGTVMYSYEIITKTEPWKRDTRGVPPWIDYPLRLLALLQNNDITPVVVFDGVSSPAKAPTSAKRRERKEAARAKGMGLIERGDHAAARKVLLGAFEVTPEMTTELMLELKKRKMEFVVAPYEADAQLAYMASVGSIHGIITEDSDLFAYGCEKPILFKLCATSGTVEELSMKRLLEGHGELKGWSKEELRALCVLSGCDFLPSVKGMGFKTALKVIKKFGTRSGTETLEKTLRQLRTMDRWKEGCTEEYCEAASRAVEAFTHGLVYDVDRGTCVFMNEEGVYGGEEGASLELCGRRDLTHLGPRMVRGEAGLLERVCRGEVCGRTFEPIQARPKSPGPLMSAFALVKKKEEKVKGGIFSFVFDERETERQKERQKEREKEKEMGTKSGKENEAIHAVVVSPDKKKRKGSMDRFIEFWKPAGSGTSVE